MEERSLETQHITEHQEPGQGKSYTQQLQEGTTLMDRYLIQGILGVGGMGAVYRARDLHFPNVTKLVAVKEMVHMTLDPVVRKTIVRNFEREANILATLDHRAIPRIYDFFTLAERSYLVLEYVNGKDLEVIINDSEGFLPQERVVGWALELCDVLNYLHTHKPDPIIFRDMKPSNVMVNAQGHIVLVDFGIAKTFETGQRGTMIGTEGYSPPEQYRGEATPLADIYALGATIHHALTRRDPRLEAPFSFGERPIHKINPAVTQDLEDVVCTALQYNPGDRYPTAQAMKEALLGVARKTGILTQVASPAMRKEGAVTPIWTFACEDEIRGAPACADGLVYAGSYDNNLYAINAATGSFAWKYATDGGVVTRPAVHDGSLYFGSEDHRLHVITANTGRINWTYYTDGPVRSSPTLAEGHAFFGSDDGCLHAVNQMTGRRAWKFDSGAPVRSTPFVSSDQIYFGNEAGELISLGFSGSLKWRFNAKRAVTSSPVVHEGVVYFGSVDSTLYALDARTGWVIWRYRLGKPSISTPCFAENYIFTGAADGIIYCLDANTSKEIWRFSTEHQVTGSPVIYKDSLYCGSVDGHLYCLEYRSGRLRWKFKTGGPITGTPAAYDNTIIIGSIDHCLYALMA